MFLNYDDIIARSPFEDFPSALTEEPECVLAAIGVALCVVRQDFEFSTTGRGAGSAVRVRFCGGRHLKPCVTVPSQ